MSNIRATIITIGDELLIGQVIDTNSAWLAQHLNALGIDVIRRIAIGDNKKDITSAIDEEIKHNNILLLTGGLGPTADDITKPLLNEYFGGKMIVDEAVLAHVKDIFAKRNRPFLDRNLKQAEVPDVCTVLFNKMGTAPGMWFEKDGVIIISLPGVPFEMIGLMENEVLPRLRQRMTGAAIVHRSIITAGEGESFVAEQIQDLEEALPAHIRLAYLPSPGMVRLRLTARGEDEQSLIRETEARQHEFAARLKKIVVATEDLPLEHILGKILTVKGWQLGLAESCTGGFIAHRMTQIMGSAGYFNGSIVCYQNFIKEKILGVQHSTIENFGVVSEDVAREMAAGARKVLASDIGFGVTGLLSPGGEDRAPVGTVCMAVTDGDKTIAKTFHFHMDRLRNKDLAVNHSLLMMIRFINGDLG